jgi:hypothetical protein
MYVDVFIWNEDFYMTYNTIKIEYLNDLREAYIEFFAKKSIQTTNLSNLLDTLVDYYKVRYLILGKYLQIYGLETFKKLDDSEQFMITLFFGDKEHEGLEKTIKSNILFWSIYTLFIKKNEFPSFQLKRYEEALNRFDRHKTDMSIRITSFETMFLVYNVIIEIKRIGQIMNLFSYLKSIVKDNRKNTNKEISKNSDRSYKLYKKLISDKSKIKTYRGFDIDSNEDIRVGRKLKSNPKSYNQDSGKGISYSPDKKLAQDFALNKWKLLTSKVDWNKRVSWNELLLEIEGIDINKFKENTGRKPVLGLFEVDVKNIVYPFLDFEKEIVAFPQNVKLLNYKFLKYSI